MYVKMDKVKEDNLNVYYKFSINTWVLNEAKKEYEKKENCGYCKFNKETEAFELDREKTDPYFSDKSREVIKVKIELIRRKREKAGFPEKIDIATG